MKTFIVALTLLSTHSAIAASADCHKLVQNKAAAHAEKQVADDCFSEYVQDAKEDANTVYVGVRCDHSGSWQYKFVTKPAGKSCTVLKQTRKFKG